MPGTKRWTTKEIKILRDNFQKSGVDACVTLLPGRSYDAIRFKAQSMGLKTSKRRHAGGYRQRIPADVKAELAKLSGKSIKFDRAVKLAAKWGVTIEGAKQRIETAGGTVLPKRHRWTQEHDAYLREMCDQHPATIAKRISREFGVKRSVAAVYQRLHILGIADNVDEDCYSSKDLSYLLGIGTTSVHRLISSGALAAKRSVPKCGRGGSTCKHWRIPHESVSKMLRSDPVLLARVRKTADRLWLSDLLGEIDTKQPARLETSVCDLSEYRAHMPGAYL